MERLNRKTNQNLNWPLFQNMTMPHRLQTSLTKIWKLAGGFHSPSRVYQQGTTYRAFVYSKEFVYRKIWNRFKKDVLKKLSVETHEFFSWQTRFCHLCCGVSLSLVVAYSKQAVLLVLETQVLSAVLGPKLAYLVLVFHTGFEIECQNRHACQWMPPLHVVDPQPPKRYDSVNTNGDQAAHEHVEEVVR